MSRLTALIALLWASGAWAQWRPQPAKSPPTSSAMEEARRRYRRALQLYEQEGNVEASLAELERAYDLAPNYKVLFNIGQAARAAREYVVSLRAFERYLADGGKEIPLARRLEVEGQIGELQGFVAQLEVVTKVVGAVVTIDDAVVGTTPLDEPVLVVGGRRTVRINKEGAASTQVLTVAGGDRLRVEMDLAAPQVATVVHPGPSVISLPELRAPERPMKRGMPYAWISWAAAGALVATTTITGAVALSRSDQLKKEPYLGDNGAHVRDLGHEVSALGIATDVIGALAAATVGVSLFVTLRKVEVEPRQPLGLHLRVGSQGISLQGRF
jgi:hypothetical protein